MNNIWEKYRSRVSKSEYNLVKNSITEEQLNVLSSTFDEIIIKYLEYSRGVRYEQDCNKPILVCSNRKMLLIVKGYFYLKMHDLPRYTEYTLEEIASDDKTDEDKISFTDVPGLAVLYIDKNINDYGKYEQWYARCISSKLTERSRKENLTLVLTEIYLPDRIMGDKEEYHIIKMGELDKIVDGGSSFASNKSSYEGLDKTDNRLKRVVNDQDVIL